MAERAQPRSIAAMRQQIGSRVDPIVQAATSQAAAATRAVAAMKKREAELEASIARFKDKHLKAHSKGRQLAVDMGGGAVAMVSTELINWMVRKIKDWSGDDSWWGRNVDFLQSMPHLVLGSLTYLAEVMTRPGGEKPLGMSRQLTSEVAKLFAFLGSANLVRALRVRSGDKAAAVAQGQRAAVDLAAKDAEIDAMKKRLAQLENGKPA